LTNRIYFETGFYIHIYLFFNRLFLLTFQEIKAGKKSLKAVHASDKSPFKSPSSPGHGSGAAKSPEKKVASAKCKKGNSSSTTESDTDSADSDDENGREFKRKQEESKKKGGGGAKGKGRKLWQETAFLQSDISCLTTCNLLCHFGLIVLRSTVE
jgi:hypothetical protein